ncbi:MAG: hypothetical protein COB14_00015 [Alphaproteobacteria bacterium]|nr:MAG: hypothetical protein COB14_00015 [Alphaproteobacteria bacterium]
MRKFIFFLLLLPAVLALGHDIYIFTQEQEKGLRLSDVGALWDKYHKESHDQWKIKLHEMSETVRDLSPFLDQPQSSPTMTASSADEGNTPTSGYTESFTQTNTDGQGNATATTQQQSTIQIQTNNLQKAIGFLLEQTAVFVFAGFAALAYILNAICVRLCRKKTGMDDLTRLKKKKGTAYKYGRK